MTHEHSQNPQKILIIEDDHDLLELYKISLSKGGFEVSTASNGYEGIDKIQEGCDLILLDMMMPEANGKDVLSLLQVHEQGSQIPVIIISNMGTQDINISQLDTQVLDYWIKAEITPAILVQRLRDYFSSTVE